MTTNAHAPAPPVAPPAIGQAVRIEDVYRLIGGLYLEVEVQRRLIAHLREQLAAHGVAETPPPA